MQPGTLITILQQKRNLDNTGITFIEGSRQEEFLSYDELYQLALRALSLLQQQGMQPGNELVIQTGDNKTFLIAFWACILGGIIPVPLSMGQNDDHRQKLFNVWQVLNNPFLLISLPNFEKLGVFAANAQLRGIPGAMQKKIIDENRIMQSGTEGIIYPVKENDIAFIQFSSGSTGQPKGVVLTHKNLITNIQSISNAAGYSSADSMISWMPLTHDMGLIGFHINPLFCGMNQYLIPTGTFVRRPALWLDKTSEHKINIICSPNFGYKYFIKHCHTTGNYEWNLQHVRILYNGAEPVSVQLCHEFLDFLAPYGLKRNAMCPVYGLAEATLAVSISGMHDEVISIHANRHTLNTGDQVVEENTGKNTIAFVNVGKAVDECSVRIASDENHIVNDRVIGEVQIKGNNVTAGYYNNKTATRKTFTGDGWLKTGDLGFMLNGSLYITGRAKDILFVNGQNYYPHDIERVAEEIEGIELNKIAVSGCFNNKTRQEEIIAFVFFRGNIEEFLPVAAQIKAVVNNKTGVNIHHVIPVKDIPRTTSGKLQRFKLTERYLNGEYNETVAAINRLMSEQAATTKKITEPGNETEQKLLAIWKHILQTGNIGIDEPFFAIGGNSLKAAEMNMMLLQEWHIELPVETLYEKQTIHELAKIIATTTRQPYHPIPVIDKAEYYAVSPVQKRMYYYWQTDATSIAYNTPVAFNIHGAIDIERLKNCIQTVVSRHDALRTSFHLHAGPVCRVHNEITIEFNCSENNSEKIGETLGRLVRPFDLANAPLFRVELITLAPGRHILFTDFHHIITDGLSIYNFIGEILAAYKGDELPQLLPVQYKDFVYWEQNNIQAGKLQLQEAYWLNQLQGELPVLDMPCNFVRPVIFDTAGAKLASELPAKTCMQLRELARANQCTLHVLLFTIYTVLLSKYTAQEELVIGIPVARRRHPNLQKMQGMFVNNLAIRSVIAGSETFATLLENEKKLIVAALHNQDYPFDSLLQNIPGKRDVSRNPVFDNMFIYQDMGLPEIDITGISFSRCFFDPGFSKYDISMEVFDDGNGIQYYIEYATSLFRAGTIKNLAGHFENLVNKILHNPNAKLAELHLLSDEEYHNHIYTFNDTKNNYPGDKAIHQLIEEQVVKTPHAIAIEFGSETITYHQLNHRANQLANLLKNKHAGTGHVVGILLPRSPRLIISILAVLKTGACYLPIETGLPNERIDYLIADSRCKLIITGNNFVNKLQPAGMHDVEIINIDEPVPANTSFESNSTVAPCDLAYIIYTSGTTGRPKGVMIEHRSLVNYIHWAALQYVKNEQVAFPLYTSIAFDLTVTSVFTPLVTGNKIVVYEDDDKELLIEKVIADNKAGVIKLTPSHLKIIAGMPRQYAESRVKRFIVGGEQLETRLAKEIYNWFGGKIEIYNEYGPTEATVGCMIHLYQPHEKQLNVPVGVPASNAQIYILDKYLQPVPVGVKGELYISGDGIAKGYLYNDELTRQKFIPGPFYPGQRMYKTGDIARHLPGGIMEYIGRWDQQVKINGYRIELAEIEYQLTSHEGIEKALVTVKENKKKIKHLYAYYTGNINQVSETGLRNYLAARLPYYMIPVHFMALDHIPLTKNGKVDYDALPAPVDIQEGRLPANEVEAFIIQAWEVVLDEKEITPAANFFELGGDSIKAVQVASWLQEKGISVQAKDILTYHTIEQISLHAGRVTGKNIYEQETVEGEKGLTPVEAWFFENNFSNPGYYNQSVLLQFKKNINIELLQKAFNRLVQHHDGLRLNYNRQKNVLFYNNDHLLNEFIVERYEITEDENIETAIKNYCETIKSGFDISTSLLLKAATISVNKKAGLLFITAHHLVTDGISWRILLEHLRHVYTVLEQNTVLQLPPKTASLVRWENAMKQYAGSGAILAEQAYWNAVLAENFTIPADFNTSEWKVEHLQTATGKLSREETLFLVKEAHKTYKTDIYILLNTALALALYEWTGRRRFVVEQENHGRHLENIDTSGTTGWFTAMYPVILEYKDGGTGEQVRAIKEQVKKIPGNGLGYGIGKYLLNQYNAHKGKITEIRFNYLGLFDKELDNDLFAYSNYSTGRESDTRNHMTAKLEWNIMIIAGELRLEINYNQKAHAASTIHHLAAQFIHKLQQLLQHIKNEGDIYFTPSDFDAVVLNQQELDTLFR